MLNKVTEETSELLEEPSLEEMADVLEVIYALAETMGFSSEELESARETKQKLRGGFKKGLIIKSK